MNKKVLILSGGISKERLISLDTGFQVAKELKKNGYKVKVCEPDKNLTKSIKKIANITTSNISKYWRLFLFKKIKFWLIKVIKVNTPKKTDITDIIKNHLKLLIVFSIFIT